MRNYNYDASGDGGSVSVRGRGKGGQRGWRAWIQQELIELILTKTQRAQISIAFVTTKMVSSTDFLITRIQ